MKNVSVSVPDGTVGVPTGTDGSFRITIPVPSRALQFSLTGYHSRIIPLGGDSSRPLTVYLATIYTQLGVVSIQGKRGRYRNKGNPAVELIREVIAHKPENRPESFPYWSDHQYEKLGILFDTLPRILRNNPLLKKFRFVFQNRDTTVMPGKSLVPIYLQEVFSQNFYQAHPQKEKKLVLATKNVDFGKYLDMPGISMALNRLYQDLDIYDNEVTVFTTKFESPIANLAPDFYKYYIQDTVVENGEKVVRVQFTPRNQEDLLFNGMMWVTLDGRYAIRHINLGASKHINLNWVRSFQASEDFEKGPGGHYYRTESKMTGVFSPFPRLPAVYGERMISVSQVSDSALPETIFRTATVDTLPAASRQPAGYWVLNRPKPISTPESRAYTNTDSLIHMPAYNRLGNVINLIASGYEDAGKFYIGPVGDFYSFNPVEGPRWLFGGFSNTKLSSRYYADAYLAYGTSDHRLKYLLSASYSLNNRSIYKYPYHYIQVSWLRDTRNPGNENTTTQGNGFLSSFSRGNNTKWLYNDILQVSYVHELASHLSYDIGIRYWNQQPAGSIFYTYDIPPGQADTIREIRTSELSLTLRWAPHEQFYQGPTSRSDIVNQYPVVTLEYAHGIRGLLGGEYPYDQIHLNLYKRFYFGPPGYLDLTFDGGWVGGKLPFPLLFIPPANQSYFYNYNAYNLMQFEEFVSDHYAGLDVDQFFNGFFLNKIPLIRRLRLREVLAAKILYGGIRDENNPSINPGQMKFPQTAGLNSTFPLGPKPYVEASVGIYNIFSIFRVDLVRRFTYLDHPGVSPLSILVSANFIF